MNAFQEIFNKYLQHSSCNEDQARFIWNHAIEEAAKIAKTHLTGDHSIIKTKLMQEQDLHLEQYF